MKNPLLSSQPQPQSQPRMPGNALMGGAAATPAPSPFTGGAGAPPVMQNGGGQQQAAAPIGVIGASIVGLLAQPKHLTMDDIYKALSADLASPEISPDQRRAIISDSVAFVSMLQQRLESFGPNATPQNVDGIIRTALHGLGMTLEQATAQQFANSPPPHPSAVAPEEVDKAHRHLDSVVDGILNLTSKPQGQLDKRHLYEAASSMMKAGAFPTRESRAHLMGELASTPDDEASIRSRLGNYLGRLVGARQRIEATFGPRRANRG